MKTRLVIRPGQNGTKKLLAKYGVRLLAVRYRYDETRRRRLKTVELIEEELPWDPPMPKNRDPDELVLVRLQWDELDLRAAVKSAGGRWQQDRKLWQLRYAAVYGLALESRIVV